MIPILSSLTEHSILQQPQSQSQFLGREAVFQCTIEVSELIIWRVNLGVNGIGLPPVPKDSNGTMLKGLKYSINTLNSTGPVKASNLTVSAIMDYHEKDISCTGVYYNGSEYTLGDKSTQVVLQVQGMFIHLQICTQGLIPTMQGLIFSCRV